MTRQGMDSSSRGSGSETGERSGLGHWPIALAMAWCLTALIPAPVAEWGDWRDWAWPLRATPPKALAVGIGLALG
ncbi:MAG TPA: hypothetical protein PKU91_08335, partial [Phycisphaerales bacterium]|nr:hypothetical protein [Phycisphaerales bacterium]